MKKAFFVILTLLIIAPSVQAQDSNPFRVSVVVSADGSTKSRVESFISRELRSLGDVVVTNDNPEWTFSIVVIEPKLENGRRVGIVLSTVILRRFNNTMTVYNTRDERKEFVSNITSNLYSLPDHLLNMGTDLREICSEIVADFDSDKLKDARETKEIFKDLFK